MGLEHLKAGLASAAAFGVGALLFFAGGGLFLARPSSATLALPALLAPLPPLLSWLALKQLNRLGLVRTWFPGNIAAGTAAAFLIASPCALSAGIAMASRGDGVFLALAAGVPFLAMLAGGAFAAVPEKPCVGRILLYGSLAAAFVVLAWLALVP